MKDIIESLKEIGFNSYEAKVYVALLKKYPATGYEVAKQADIPQSRAYDTLKSLETLNIVTSTNEKPQTYTPIKPKELTKRFRRKYETNLNFLEKELPDVKTDYTEPVHTIKDTSEIRIKIIELIKSAQKDLYLEMWGYDYRLYEQYLFEAYDRGVDIKLVSYDEIESPIATIFRHNSGREIEYELGTRLIFIISDDNECIFGTPAGKMVWTKNDEIIFLLREFISHDMCLIDIESNFPEQLKYFYGTGLKKLKEKIKSKNSRFFLH